MKSPKRFLGVDWDAVAGILAALAALILHFLHVVEAETLLALTLVLLALLLLRDLRRERQQELIAERVERTESMAAKMQGALRPPDAVLVGPGRHRGLRFRLHAALPGKFSDCHGAKTPEGLMKDIPDAHASAGREQRRCASGLCRVLLR